MVWASTGVFSAQWAAAGWGNWSCSLFPVGPVQPNNSSFVSQLLQSVQISAVSQINQLITVYWKYNLETSTNGTFSALTVIVEKLNFNSGHVSMLKVGGVNSAPCGTNQNYKHILCVCISEIEKLQEKKIRPFEINLRNVLLLLLFTKFLRIISKC